MQMRVGIAVGAIALVTAAVMTGQGTATAAPSHVVRLAYTDGRGSLRVATMTPAGALLSDRLAATEPTFGFDGGAANPVGALAWSPNGRWLLLDSFSGAAVYDAVTGRLGRYTGSTGVRTSFAVDDAGRFSTVERVAGGVDALTVRTPDARVVRRVAITVNGLRVHVGPLHHRSGELQAGSGRAAVAIDDGVVGSNGGALLTGDGPFPYSGRFVYRLDQSTGALRRIAALAVDNGSDQIQPDSAAALSPDGGTLAFTVSSGSGNPGGPCTMVDVDQFVRVLDVRTGRVTSPLGNAPVRAHLQFDTAGLVIPLTGCGAGLRTGTYRVTGLHARFVSAAADVARGPDGLVSTIDGEGRRTVTLAGHPAAGGLAAGGSSVDYGNYDLWTTAA